MKSPLLCSPFLIAILTGFCLLAVPLQSLRADELASARQLYKDDDYKGALQILRRMETTADALFLIGEIYDTAEKETHGIAASEKLATDYFKNERM